MIRFACSCGRQLQARDEDIGKKAKCPSCGAISTVAPSETSTPAPAPAPEAFAEAPQLEERVTQDRPRSMIEEEPRAARQRPRDRDDFDEERPRKRRRREVDSPTQSSGKAMASLICGIASPCLLLPSIPGLILGIWALRDIGKSDGELGGRGSAIAGIVLSCLAFILILPAALLLPAVQKVRQASERMQDTNNLKQIGLAMHNFHDTYGAFPQAAAFQDGNGKPLLSWRVALLPYIEQQNLYRQFKLNEPWDSPNNKPLIASMPQTYALPRDAKNTSTGMTYYQVFVGPGSIFEPRKEGLRPAGPQGPASLGWGIGQITDGLSNTGLVFTAQNPVIWTKPDDLMFDPQGPLPPLEGQYSSGTNIGLADGSVRMLPNPLNEQTLRAIITRNGGETVAVP